MADDKKLYVCSCGKTKSKTIMGAKCSSCGTYTNRPDTWVK